MKKNSGVSMISLVITIIVIIILAAVAFGSSTDTIENANFSNFTNDVAEVQNLLTEKAVTLKGEEGKNGVSRTDAQVYNFIAKGATTLDSNEKYWLTRAGASAMMCTELSGDVMEEAIDYSLPEIKVSTPQSNGVACTYFVTNEGKVFVWPPYIYQNELWVNGDTKLMSGDATTAAAINTEVEDDYAAVYGDGFDFKVGNTTITIRTSTRSSSGDIVYAGSNTSPVGEEHGGNLYQLDAQ